MVNYGNGRIYKVINSINNDIYVGSTCRELWNRMGQHRYKAKNNTGGKFYEAMRTNGIENYKIVLLANYPCKSREELFQKEESFITRLKPALNSYCAVFNAEKHQTNRKAEKAKKYQENKEARQAKNKIKIVCSCGQTIAATNKARHLKSANHQNIIKI